MSDLVRDSSKSSANIGDDFQYPFAASPDIIRAHQKDAYFQGVLLERLTSVLRNLYGSRFAHNYANEARTFTELLYHGLTTLVGNRTLGEEYCDIVQVEDDTLQLPALFRRSGYILGTVLLPYGLTRILPAFRRRIRAKLERSLKSTSDSKPSRTRTIQAYILDHLDSITSPAPLYAASLAIFYFTGAYYHVAKRVFGLRYIFTRRLEPSEQRIGYEVLGVLLTLQLGVQAYSHVYSTWADNRPPPVAAPTAVIGAGVELSLDPAAPAANTALLMDATPTDQTETQARLRRVTHTPAPPPSQQTDEAQDEADVGIRYRLSEPSTMAWIESPQQRKCTLCWEPMRDPSATTCGHVFCWTCVRDWLTERAECPLCRQSCTAQHVLPLRG